MTYRPLVQLADELATRFGSGQEPWAESGIRAWLGWVSAHAHEKTDRELAWLVRYLKWRQPRQVVELGVRDGDFTGFLARACQRVSDRTWVFGIDLFSSAAPGWEGHSLGWCQARLRQFERAGLILAESGQAATRFQPQTVGLIFVDADHQYDAVRKDVLAWWSRLEQGGWLVCHDYRSVPDVAVALGSIFRPDQIGVLDPDSDYQMAVCIKTGERLVPGEADAEVWYS